MTEKKRTKVKFRTDNPDASSEDLEEKGVIEALKHQLKVSQLNSNNLQKSVDPIKIKKNGKYDKSKISFSARNYERGFDGVEMKGFKRLSDRELREVAQLDPYISAIISTRCAQSSIIARPSDSKFDKGTRVLELQPLNQDDFPDEESYSNAQDVRKKQMDLVLKWVLACGTADEETINEVFQESDPTFKTCSLSDFVVSQVRNLLTFGRMGSQIFRNEEKVPVMFRPVPIETIFHVQRDRDVHIGKDANTMKDSVEDVKDFNKIPKPIRPAGYMQRIDGRNVNFFTEQDLKISYYQKQALFDLMGYPLAPIEQAIYMVFIHQNTLSYLRNQFIKGLGTKGVLVLSSQDPAAELSDEDLDVLRREFHNFLNRTDNSATTPVISGAVQVDWVNLSATPDDMQFLQIEEHVIRALCSAFQTSPQEMGYGHLGLHGGGLSDNNRVDETIRGEERGLRLILDVVYDHINEILYENFPEARGLFRITFTGVGEDTRDAVIERGQQELQTTATMASLWADSEKNEPIPIGGNVPLAPLFHANIAKYLKYGQFMESFFGMDGWADKPEYDFIIDPALNQAYQEMKMFSDQMRRMQGELQIESQGAELQGMQQQMEQAEQQAEMMQQMPQEGEMPPQGAEGEEEAAQAPGIEETEKSRTLLQEYQDRSLRKSIPEYFSEYDNYIKSLQK